jgi:hypothetical protein
MSTLSRTLIIALSLRMANAMAFEWKGVFYTPDTTYKWGVQKVNGKYAADNLASMKFVAIPVSGATEQALTSATPKGTTAMGLTCEDVQKNGVIKPMENKCYKMIFDSSTAQTLYTIDASSAGSIAFFTEHLPTEFEATAHYFKDNSGVDIEPVAQAPLPGSTSGHSHGHGGTAQENFDRKCVCQAQSHNWKLDCANQAKISQAVTDLKANAACAATNPPKSCIDKYYVMQAHHDHCLHHQLPTAIEKDLHSYESFYNDCFIKRQYDATLLACPAVTCTDATAMTTAISTLQNVANDCKTTTGCAKAQCAAAIKVVLMAHDTCPEDKLPNNLETALHDYEEPCARQLCNSAAAAFDPYADKCSASVVSGGFGSQNSFLVTTSLLPLVVLFFS